MASSQSALQVGNQPHNGSDHAAQILEDIAALREYWLNVQKRDKNPPWTHVDAVLKSVESFIEKTRSQPSNEELLNDMHETAKTQREIKDEVTAIKTLLENAQNSSPKTAAPKNTGMTRPLQEQTRPAKTMHEREITVKLDNPTGETHMTN
jgi:hypothetical protein